MKNLLKNPLLIYALLGVVGLYFVYKLGSGVGSIFEDTEGEAKDKDQKREELKKAKTFLNTLLGLNWFDIVFKPYDKEQNEKGNWLLPKMQALNKKIKENEKQLFDKAEDLDDAFGLNADEATISGILGNFRTQYEIFFFAYTFENLYKYDIYQKIEESFSDSELINLYRNLSQKIII